MAQQQRYCEVWAGVDDIPPYDACMTSLVGVQPDTRHACCGKIGVFGGANVHGICSFVYKSADSTCPTDQYAELPDSCCEGAMVGIEQPCTSAVCAGRLQPAATPLASQLTPTLALHGAVGPSKQQECLARQWRTRAYECMWSHQISTPHSERSITWTNSIRDHFRGNPALVQQFSDYLDHIDRTEDGALRIEHMQGSPVGDLTFGDPEVVLCLLPMLRNQFTHVPLSTKFKQFMSKIVILSRFACCPSR